MFWATPLPPSRAWRHLWMVPNFIDAIWKILTKLERLHDSECITFTLNRSTLKLCAAMTCDYPALPWLRIIKSWFNWSFSQIVRTNFKRLFNYNASLVWQIHDLRSCSEVFPKPCRSYPAGLELPAKTSQYVPGLEMGLALWNSEDVRVVVRNECCMSIGQKSVDLLFHLKR